MRHKKDIWVKVCRRLQSKMSGEKFKTWFSRTSLRRSDPEVVVLSVPNKFVANWLNDNYLRDIKKSFREVNKTSPNIHFAYDQGAVEKYHHTSDSLLERKLNNWMTFDNFMTGECNQFAWSTAKEVADRTAGDYSTSYIYSMAGLGKTHVLHAIGNHRLKKDPQCRLRYVSSDVFASDFTYAIKTDRLDQFRLDLLGLDLLLFDDIHLLAGGEKTQEEFVSIFDALKTQKKQIVITGNSPPNKLNNINAELKSRLGGGLLADIREADQSLKTAIIRKMLAEYSLPLAEDIVFFLSNSTNNIKMLLRNINRIETFRSMNDQVITISVAEALIRDKSRNEDRLEDIMSTTAGYFNISVADLVSYKRNRNYSYPRQIAMYLIRKHTDLSLKEIGDSFDHKDHSTVLYALRKIERGREERKRIQKDLLTIESLLG